MKTVKMPEVLARKWWAALRSGEFQQTEGRLHRTESGGCDDWGQEYVPGYCCLGVLQHVLDGQVQKDVAGQAIGLPTQGWCQTHGITFYTQASGVCQHDPLLGDVLEGGVWMQCVDPYLPTLEANASVANDELHSTFAEIADALEACTEFTP